MADTTRMPEVDPKIQPLAEKVVAEMERLHVPGVAVGLSQGDKDYVAGFGVTSVENPLAVDADTLFQIGSTTKTFTGTAAMRLADQGKLDLDAPIRAYLPDLRLIGEGVADQVTLRHLFTHTGGWVGDYFDDSGRGDDALARIVSRMADLPQLTPLGTTFSYNNSGFYLAGRVLEVVTGQPYETVIKESIFDPLGMTRSFFFPEEVMTYRFAVGHIVKDDQPEVARPWNLARAAHAAGGIASTARDQLRYARFQMGDGTTADGTRLLTSAAMAEMQRPAVPAGSATGAVGVTWMIKTVEGVTLVRHGGATNGQLSAFLLAPERDFAITVLTNANRGAELHGEVVKWALQHYLGISEPLPEPQTPSDAELATYAGRYRAAMSELELRPENGALILQVTPKGGFPYKDSPPGPTPPPVRLAICGDDSVVALDPPFKDARGEFVRDPDGSIAWLRFGGRLARRQD